MTFDISSIDCISIHNSESFPSMGTTPICGIYAIKNTVSGEFYIGSSEHVARRFVAHKSQLNRGVHHSYELQRDWKELGSAAFQFIILESVSVDEGLTNRESELIADINPKYNTAECTANPMKGRKHSPESISKMKIARTGKGLGPRIFTEAHKAALSASLKGKPNGQLGLKRSDETKALQSASAKLRGCNSRLRPVEFRGTTYPSGVAAANDNNISRANVDYRIKVHGEGRYLDAA